MSKEDIEIIKGALHSIAELTERYQDPLVDRKNLIATIKVKAKDAIEYINLVLKE